MKHLLLFWVCITLLLPRAAAAEDTDKEAIQQFVDQLFQARAQALLQNRSEPIHAYYIPQEKASRYALDHELYRNDYMHTWADKRHVVFVGASSEVRITNFKKHDDRISISLTQSLKLTYAYKDGQTVAQDFGIGTKHYLSIKKSNNQWRVSKEWYLDPLEEDPKLVPTSLSKKQPMAAMPAWTAGDDGSSVAKGKYNRQKAIGYADKYAGLAWGAGNDHKYNSKYKDYSGGGGDCTNFSSQIIADPDEGGGLRMSSSWYYRGKGGSTDWIRTDSFKNYILHSGNGRLVVRGKYPDVTKPNSRFPNGPFAEIKAGDLIGYELHPGDVDHFSFVVGFDGRGYALVDSHSADRYHVPWDLGWDKNTIFWLIHLKD